MLDNGKWECIEILLASIVLNHVFLINISYSTLNYSNILHLKMFEPKCIESLSASPGLWTLKSYYYASNIVWCESTPTECMQRQLNSIKNPRGIVRIIMNIFIFQKVPRQMGYLHSSTFKNSRFYFLKNIFHSILIWAKLNRSNYTKQTTLQHYNFKSSF